MKTLLLAVVLAMAALPDVAVARECVSWGERTVQNRYWPYDYRTQTYCRRYREDHHSRYYSAPREIRLEMEVRGHDCVDPIRSVGIEKYGRERAKESADGQWAETVRARIGGRYMDLKNARRVTYECWQSSTGNRTSEKLTEGASRQVLEQCEVTAYPCRAPKSQGDEDKR